MIHNFKITATYADNPKEIGMCGTIEANAVTRREAELICDELIRKDTRIIKSIKFELEGKTIYEEDKYVLQRIRKFRQENDKIKIA